MFKIYGYPTFNPIKVVLTAEELGMDYEYVHVELSKGEHKLPEHIARHPLGRVPALEHDGQLFVESASICRYLARIHDNRLYAADPAAAARIDQTADMLGHHVSRWFGSLFFEEVIAARYFKREPKREVLEEAKGFLDSHLPAIDKLLADREFLCGDQVTIADTISFPTFQAATQTSYQISPDLKNVVRWYGNFAERPSVARVQARIMKP